MKSDGIHMTARIMGFVVLGAIVVVVTQQARLREMKADMAALRKEASSLTNLSRENARLRENLETTAGNLEKNVSELVRLRADAAKLRVVGQENARLKAEREQLIKNVAQPEPVISQPAEEQTPEMRFRMAYGRFGCDLAKALCEARDENENFPNELTDAVLGKNPDFKTNADLYNQHGLKVTDFERLYKGSWNDLKHHSETILVRLKNPVQLPDGKWMKVYGFADGHSQLVSSDTLDGFAAIEKERDYWPTEPNQ